MFKFFKNCKIYSRKFFMKQIYQEMDDLILEIDKLSELIDSITNSKIFSKQDMINFASQVIWNTQHPDSLFVPNSAIIQVEKMFEKWYGSNKSEKMVDR